MTNQPPDPASAEARIEFIAKSLPFWKATLSIDRAGIKLLADTAEWLLAHVTTITEQLTSANARFCDQHRGIYRTSGCVVCGLMAAAVELRESEAKAATLTEQRDDEKKHRLSLQQTLDEWQAQIRRLQSEHRRALDQMDTETARANGLGEINQQLGAKLRALEAALGRAVETIRTWHGMGMPATVRYAEAAAWALYQESPEMKAITAALAAARATEPPQEPQP